MSHQVEIDYRNIAARCESICEVAEAVLQKLDDMLAKLQKTSA